MNIWQRSSTPTCSDRDRPTRPRTAAVLLTAAAVMLSRRNLRLRPAAAGLLALSIGMLLLTACLQLKWINLRRVEGIANFLVKNLGFVFIPPGVALMLHLNIIKAQLLPIIAASVVSTVVVIIVTGQIHQLVRKYQHGLHK